MSAKKKPAKKKPAKKRTVTAWVFAIRYLPRLKWWLVPSTVRAEGHGSHRYYSRYPGSYVVGPLTKIEVPLE